VRAAVVAGLFSGIPSTALAILTGKSPLAAARAAGVLLGRAGLPRGIAAHALVSFGWSTVMSATLPERDTVAWGAAAGAAIAALDIGIVGRRIPAIRSLPAAGQILDHLAFGALVGAVLERRDRG